MTSKRMQPINEYQNEYQNNAQNQVLKKRYISDLDQKEKEQDSNADAPRIQSSAAIFGPAPEPISMQSSLNSINEEYKPIYINAPLNVHSQSQSQNLRGGIDANMGPIFYVQNNSSLLNQYNKNSVGNNRPQNNFNDPSQIYGIELKQPNSHSKVVKQMAPRINLGNNKHMKRVSPTSLSPKSPKQQEQSAYDDFLQGESIQKQKQTKPFKAKK